MSKATILIDSREVEDPEQAFLLNELIRFLKHPSSGVSSFARMSKGWSSLCASVKQGATLRKKDPAIAEAVLSWHQLVRFLALELTASVSQPVQVHLTRRQTKDPASRVADDVDSVIRNSLLVSEISIPNAASSLVAIADLRRRTLNLAMKLQAPTDRKRATASINWLLRQLKSVEREDLLIRAVWPRRLRNTTASIADVRNDPSCLIHEGVRELPQSFEVIRVIDMAGKFSGVKTFVECASAEIPQFYRDVGQQLRAWVAPPPRLKRKATVDEDKSSEPTQSVQSESDLKEPECAPPEDPGALPGISSKLE